MVKTNVKVWLNGIPVVVLSPIAIALYQPDTWAATLSANSCDIPISYIRNENPIVLKQTQESFKNETCEPETLAADTIFYRYYSQISTFPGAPPPENKVNIGQFLTLDLFTDNSIAIVQLALLPSFNNFAFFRETVKVLANTTVYKGIAGPQPVSDPSSCYAGGATQYFTPQVQPIEYENFVFNGELTRTGDPCKIPEPSPLLGLVVLASLGLVSGLTNRLNRPVVYPIARGDRAA